jgi:hypothetical protein
MNKERILALAAHIEQQPHADYSNYDATIGFNMGWTVHPSCGTPCCIAGWATWESLGRPIGAIPARCEPLAAEYLGLDYETGHQLFYPPQEEDRYSVCYSSVTPEQAASVMRELVETGEVNWFPIYEEQQA